MVERLLRTIDTNIPYRAVRATRGKLTRAEPISALYEQKRVHHLGFYEELEAQMCSYTGLSSESSPDRLDALVWGLFELSKSRGNVNWRITYCHYKDICLKDFLVSTKKKNKSRQT